MVRHTCDSIIIKKSKIGQLSFLLDTLRELNFIFADYNGFWAHISRYRLFSADLGKTPDIPNTTFSNRSQNVYRKFFLNRDKKNPKKLQKEHNIFFKEIERIIGSEIHKDFKKFK